MTIDFVNHC